MGPSHFRKRVKGLSYLLECELGSPWKPRRRRESRRNPVPSLPTQGRRSLRSRFELQSSEAFLYGVILPPLLPGHSLHILTEFIPLA